MRSELGDGEALGKCVSKTRTHNTVGQSVLVVGSNYLVRGRLDDDGDETREKCAKRWRTRKNACIKKRPVAWD